MPTIYLPDTLAQWSWSRKLNKFYPSIKSDSGEWRESFKMLSPSVLSACRKAEIELLCALEYPNFSADELRTACDALSVFFVLHEYTDLEDGSTVRSIVNITLDAIRNPYKPRPDGELFVGEMSRQFWVRALEKLNPTLGAQEWFINQWDKWTTSVVVVANNRSTRRICGIDEYLKMRRINLATGIAYATINFTLGLDKDILDHCSIVKLLDHASDMICLCNDMYSYDVEQSRGDSLSNIFTVVSTELNIDLDGASKWIADTNDKTIANFFAAKEEIPSWGEDIDSRVATFVDGVGMIVRANDSWSLECGRYFEDGGATIQKTRMVALRPKRELRSVDECSR